MAVVTVTLNPAIDLTLILDRLQVDANNKARQAHQIFAGKGINVAQVLRSLAVPVKVTGFLGADSQHGFAALFARLGMTDAFVRIPGHCRINAKLIATGASSVTDVNGPGIPVPPEAVESLRQKVRALADSERETLFVLSGSLPPGVPDDFYAELISILKAKNKIVILDAGGNALEASIPSMPQVLKPDIRDSLALEKGVYPDWDALSTYARQLLDQGIERVLLSLGDNGMLWATRHGCLRALPPPLNVESMVGAGDGLIAGLVYGLLKEWDENHIARFACARAFLALSEIGVGSFEPSVIDDMGRKIALDIC